MTDKLKFAVIGVGIMGSSHVRDISKSENVALADACASMLGNLISSDKDMILKRAVEEVASVTHVIGCAAIVGDKIAFKGCLPRIVPACGTFSRASRILIPNGPK